MVAYRRWIAVALCTCVGLAANAVSSAGEPWTGLQVIERPDASVDMGVEAGSAEATILRKLESRVHIRVTDMPLTEFRDLIREQLEIPVHLDATTDDIVGKKKGPFVTVASENIRMRSLLELVLGWYELTWGIRNETLLIASEDHAERVMAVRVYDLEDFPAEPGNDFDYDSLIELITCIVEPNTWSDVGGLGSIDPVEAPGTRAISITHAPRVHEKIVRLLDELRGQLRYGGLGTLRGTHRSARSSARDIVAAALARKCTDSLYDVTLNDFLSNLTHTMETEIHLDRRSLKKTPFKTCKPITLEAAGISARASLGLILDDREMDFAVVDDFIVICRKDAVNRFDDFRVYEVTDLMRAGSDVEHLRRTLASSIDPTSWEDVGGHGWAVPYTCSGRRFLVISQRWRTFEKIEKWLTDVRALRQVRYTRVVPRQRSIRIRWRPCRLRQH